MNYANQSFQAQREHAQLNKVALESGWETTRD